MDPVQSAPARPIRVLFFMEHLRRYLRFFDPVIRELLDRGHIVHLVFEKEVDELGEDYDAWLREMHARPGFRSTVNDAWRQDPWFRVARPLRGALDYAHSSWADVDRAPFLISRARRRSPLWGRVLQSLASLGGERGTRLLERLLATLERGIPPSRRVREIVRTERPDVVVSAPHLMPGSTDTHYVRAAMLAGAPVCVCVPSWDNLSSKQLLHVVPDAITVWNDFQRREAVELHGIPEERVVVTGAQSFDQWFEWPPRGREEFCARVGLDPSRPYVLYLAGALFPSTLTEAEWLPRWIESLRSRGGPALQAASILVRPHPLRMADWEAFAGDVPGGVTVWPRSNDAMPVGEAARADYFDSIHHSAAVVGINTSAMLEAAIAGKAVHTVLVPEFWNSQDGVFHFRYLREAGGGLLRVARDLDEHVAQLEGAVSREDRSGEAAAERFVASFIRPHGRDVRATDRLVSAIEGLAETGARAGTREARWVALLRPLLAAGMIPFLFRRVRWKLAFEARRARRRIGQPESG